MIIDRINEEIKNIRLFFRNVWLLLSFDPLDKPIFSFICGVFSLIICTQSKNAFYRLLIDLRGIRYIDKENMIAVGTSYDTLILLFLFLIIMTFCALFEIGGLLHSFSMGQVGRDTDIWSMMMAGARTCKKTLQPRNWLLILFVMVLFPLTGLMTLSNIAYKAKIPSFVQLGIEAKPSFLLSFRIVFALLVLAEIAFFFSINIYVLTRKNFLQSCADSWRLGKSRLLNTILCMLLLSLLTNIAIDLLSKLFFSGGTMAAALKQIIRTIAVPSINNAGMTALFYQYYEEEASLAGIIPTVFRTKRVSPLQKSALVCLGLLLIAGSLFYYAKNYAFLAEDVKQPLVCAHRGDNVHAPDNSYEAFELAVAEKVPWIELDVQITADNVVVAEHDQSLSRRFGIRETVADFRYDDLKEYRVISSDERYQNVQITTLEDVLKLAKENGMQVQIETKPSRKKSGLEEEVLRLVEESGMHERVMIISLHSESIKKIKELNPDMTTAHVVMKTWKDYAQVDDADNLSAEIGTVTPLLVQELHEAGMKVFCWTADDPDEIQYLVSCGVDVIGTDDPVMVIQKLQECDRSGGIARCFHLMMHVLADMER
jgi:glycerophosphoryl diester phosphodiesterase